MTINPRTRQAEARERRLGAITRWEGGALKRARESAFTDLAPDGRCAHDWSSRRSRIGESPIPFSSTWEGAPARSCAGSRGPLRLRERVSTAVVRQSTDEDLGTLAS
ncbi:hypothetical protein CCR94_01315 [Rhodoblastus sphagnicola]|uniref:Uncharacterized protein n=1 Tax=Rhodoblastus sphagnicola TaxID=333368 RepID=A0A2S6NFZ0_9HYPH|nr:hypothetical protein [Rhodoblastus sphagnicola]MBB4199522.1 hypothetical protein [Rhodoblastus sphagnicola]PPQ33521.1 hypothetical protein CCR94_01315 [Rhodoblastus sphagnicola]